METFVDLQRLRAILQARVEVGVRAGRVAFLVPTDSEADAAEFDQVLLAYGIAGIQMTPDTLTVLNKNLTPSESF